MNKYMANTLQEMNNNKILFTRGLGTSNDKRKKMSNQIREYEKTGKFVEICMKCETQYLCKECIYDLRQIAISKQR